MYTATEDLLRGVHGATRAHVSRRQSAILRHSSTKQTRPAIVMPEKEEPICSDVEMIGGATITQYDGVSLLAVLGLLTTSVRCVPHAQVRPGVFS